MKRTTKELMSILNLTNKSVLRIAENERWERLRNGSNGVHVYNVSDEEIERFVSKARIASVENRVIAQDEATKLLLGLIDRRVCAVSFEPRSPGLHRTSSNLLLS